MRKNLFKKLAATLLAGTLLLTMVVGVAANPQYPTVEPGETGSLTINKTDGTNALTGAEFTLYRVMDLKLGTGARAEYADYTRVSHFSGSTGLGSSVTPNALGNYDTKQLEDLAGGLASLARTAPAEVTYKMTTTGAISNRTGLPLGYYLAVETKTPAGYSTMKPFLVAIPSTNNYSSGAAGTYWEYDVVVTPKNEKIELDKKITNANGDYKNGTAVGTLGDADTVAVGDTVHYQVSTKLPVYGNEYTAAGTPIFSITDTLTGLNLNTTSIVVKAGGTQLTAGVEYTLTPSPTTTSFTVRMAETYLKTAANHGKTITVDYSAVVRADAVRGSAGNPNKVELTYSTSPSTTAKEEIIRKVYTYDLKIQKTDVGQTTPLAGATFVLYKADASGNITTDVATAATAGATTGLIEFKGIDAGVYYIKETVSPAGYTLLTNPIKVVIEAQKTNGWPNGEVKFYVDNKEITTDAVQNAGKYQAYRNNTTGIVGVAVENKKGFTLPGTGGMGITVFLAVAFIGITMISMMLVKAKKARS